MEWTSLNELREKYLSFFESKGHLRLESFPLIPQNDKSLLLINSGMAPMKKYFTGEITPPRTRVTSCQKCIRTPDIERVGKTARHGTYFEMLGNFSFGDYFKNEAIAWGWEFCTQVMKMPVENIYVSVYEEDDESYDVWANVIGVDPSHIVHLGKEDNFWEHGAGPCGPCSELYYDRGEKYGCGKPDCKVGCDCDRYVEFWNIVFSQFSNDGNNNYTPLKQKNIDTGMGLERLACISQGVDNLFEVDTVQNIMKHIVSIAGVGYHESEKTDVSLRVITDHIRSTTFMIGDGVLPSNEGRGYVLRRLLRRAARHGRLMGIERPFLAEVAQTVIKENASAYPNLVEKRDYITKIISIEEDKFAKTIDTGLSILTEKLDGTEGEVLSGADAFLLSDTYGFPIDLTREIAEERGMEVDEQAWSALVLEQRERSRNARADAGADAWKNSGVATKGIAATAFAGYEGFDCDAQIIAIVTDDGLCEYLESGKKATLILDSTSFYAESGGQVGDVGVISGKDYTFRVENTTKTHDGVFLHHGELIQGESLAKGDAVAAHVDTAVRLATMRNHTSAHLLQAALRKVLGTHVEQAGQLVCADSVRFDFTHFSAMTGEEIQAVENEINNVILSGIPVTSVEMPIEEAKKLGAMALFGEKYGNRVRVVRAGDFSVEFCGGTHTDNTAKLGLFKILSESSVAAGVRRIEGVTGSGVLDYIKRNEQLIYNTAAAMKVNNPADIEHRAAALVGELKQNEREIEGLKSEIASAALKDLFANAREIKGVRAVIANIGEGTADSARSMCDSAKSSEDLITLVCAVQKEKGTASFACSVGAEALKKGAHAGNIVRAVAQIAGGSGGGRPDSAMAGAKDISKLGEALESAYGIIEEMIK
ncbi:MAG: alanine--tRNA ligase [Clostridiales bacterium]|nr:alanine--tRNA ligase [Clostridiales bacterium]